MAVISASPSPAPLGLFPRRPSGLPRIKTSAIVHAPSIHRMLRVAHGHFEVLPGVDRKLRVGIFAQDRMEAWVRFSSDTSPTDPDLGSTLGVGIK
ncbi:MAG: hypothetical protein EOO70_03950, partial [Myxococcaceae bacterium]